MIAAPVLAIRELVLRRLILQASRTLKLRGHLGFRTTTFSDNIVISQPVSEMTRALVQQMAFVQIAALVNGFLVRGGITIGDIVHDDETVFGPALIRARCRGSAALWKAGASPRKTRRPYFGRHSTL